MLVMVGALMSISALAIDIMLPAFPVMSAALGVSDVAVQRVLGVFMLASALPYLVLGSIADRFGRKPVLLVGLAVFALGSVVCILAPSYEALLLGRFVQGLGASAGPIVARAVLRDLYSGRDLGRMLSFAMTVFAAVPLLAPAIGALLLGLGGWRLPFWFLLLAGLLLLVMVLSALPETLPRRDPDALSLRGVLASARRVYLDPHSGWPILVMCLAFGVLVAYLASAPVVFIDHFGMTESRFALQFALIACTAFVVQPLNVRLLRNFSSGRILGVVLPLLVLFAGLLVLQGALGLQSLWWLTPNLMAIFGCFSLIVANGTALALEPHRDRAGAASGLTSFASTVIGTLLGTWVASFAPAGLLPLALGLLALSVAAWVAGLRVRVLIQEPLS